MGTHDFAWWPVCIAVTIACITDLRSRKIPNWLVFPFLLVGFVVACVTHGGHGALKSVEGFALGVAITGVLYAMRGMGMGDVKLCAAIGVWIGPSQLLVSLVVMGLVGGVMAVSWAIAGGFLGELFGGSAELLASVGKRGLAVHPEINLDNPRGRKMPYAPAIAAGALISFFAR